MNKTLLSMLLLSSSTMAFASLISVGPVPTSGAGLGTVETLLTLTSSANTTTESGCVGAGVAARVNDFETVCKEVY